MSKMTENIMRDNLLYLEAWMSYNPALRENLEVSGNTLVYDNQGVKETVDISNFYLPEMLYNENFRKDVALSHKITGKDLFQIIKMYVMTEEILEKEQKELQMYPRIVDLKIMRDPENKEFIVLIDSNNKKYRYDTAEPKKVIDFYHDLKDKNGTVTLKDLGSVIQNGNN